MTVKQSERGKIEVFDDFLGRELPLASTGANSAPSGSTGALLNFHPLVVRGDSINDDDAGIVPVADALSGVARFQSGNSDGDACILGTETCLRVDKMAPIVVEARVEMAALTSRMVFMGLCGDFDDAQTDICTGSGTTLALTETYLCGFVYDSGVTVVNWYMPYKGGTTAGITTATAIASGVTPVKEEFDILRLEVDNNGTARWFINGVLKQTVEGACSTSAVMSAMIGTIATASANATLDVDYLYISANRDWTI